MMLKGLFKKLAGKVGVKGIAAEIVAEKADDIVTGVADRVTGGLASEAEKVVKGRKRKR